jgi:hypothetical protein
MLEGLADQILIAGSIAALLKRHGPSDSRLDLNRVTLVPSGSASHVPYMVFLARGRDQERPAIVVMVDGDGDGLGALRDLKRGGPRNKGLLAVKFATHIGEIAKEPGVSVPSGRTAVELEDLIPPRLALAAAFLYSSALMPELSRKVSEIKEEALLREWTESRTLMDALAVVGRSIGENCKFDKVGFARSVLDSLDRIGREEAVAPASMEDVNVFLGNMDALGKKLRRMQREAEQELFAEQVFERVGRSVDGFLNDHPHIIARDELAFFVEDVRRVLDDSEESDSIRVALSSIEREHDLRSGSSDPLRDVDKLKAKLSALRYENRLGQSGGSAPGLAGEGTEAPKLGEAQPTG